MAWIRRSLPALVGLAVIAALSRPVLDLRSAILQARALAMSARAYEQLGNDAVVLIVGDSTARGTGAARPEESLAGRIGSTLPGVRVVNLAKNGARFEDVSEQLANAPALPYRFVLVVAGANDVLRFTRADSVQQQAEAALRAARRLSATVVLMALPNVGNAPLIPWPLNRWYSRRAAELRDRLQAAADAVGVPLVNLYYATDDPFSHEPQRYLAEDGLHPNSDGYALWYRQLRAQAPFLFEPPPVLAPRYASRGTGTAVR